MAWKYIFTEKVLSEAEQYNPDSDRSKEQASWFGETDRIVADLLSAPLTTEHDGSSLNDHNHHRVGHMKVVRVLNSVEGRAFERVLRGCLHEFSASATKPASVIADFGNDGLYESIEPWARKCKLRQTAKQHGKEVGVLRSLESILAGERAEAAAATEAIVPSCWQCLA